jgi:uncharacterized protein YidB (DUF937 family)
MADSHNASTLALLGLLAVMGYQNRDKIAAALKGITGGATAPGAPAAPGSANTGGLGGMLGNVLGGQAGGQLGGLGGLLSGLGGTSGGSVLSGGLGDIMKSFTDAGHGEVANSWVDPSVPTQPATPQQVQQALGDTTLNELAQRTGLSTDELAKRLATAIPQTVDKLTPNGQLPDEKDAMHHLTA